MREMHRSIVHFFTNVIGYELSFIMFMLMTCLIVWLVVKLCESKN